ncbi:MAG TPA: ABC transporter permease [Thermoanaerobaculia bacterium]
MRDFLLSLRNFGRRPGFASAAILTLALGIGANVVVFSAVYGVLLRPLPYPRPDRLTLVWADWTAEDNPRVSHTGGDFQEYRRLARSFQDLAAVGGVRQVLAGSGEPTQVQVGWVSRNFFPVLGVRPVLGRGFQPGDGPSSLILGDEFWHRHFGGNPGVLGSTVRLDGQPYTVVGVLPAGFRLYLSADAGISTDIDVWKPPDEARAKARWVTPELKLSSLRVIGRLKPGVTVAQAQQEMDGIAAQLRARYPDHAEVGFQLAVRPLQDEVVGHVRPALLACQGAVAFVLLIACLNVANLMLVHMRRRQHEIALRLTLGATTARVARQVLVECFTLALLGGLLGLVLASWGIYLLRALTPASFPRIDGVALNGPVVAFAVGVTLAATAVAGLIPVLISRRWRLSGILSKQSAQAGGSDSRLSKLLIVAEVALSLVLLLGAGLLMRSFSRLEGVRPGFDPKNLLTFSINLPGVRYKAPVQTYELLERLEAKIEALPGVESASFVWPLPLEGQIWYGPYRVPDHPQTGSTPPLADHRVISPGYPRTLGTRLLEGRLFDDGDTGVVLIDEELARRNWPGRSPLGRTLVTSLLGTDKSLRVIGVLENIRHQDLKADGRETLYLPAKEWSRANFEAFVVVRTRKDPKALVAPIRRELRNLDPLIPMDKVRPMADYISKAVAPTRFALVLMAIFSAAAVVLTAVGLYGVVAYSLSRKTREIGIRMALGAQRRDILLKAIWEGLTPALIGIVLGGLGSFGLIRMIVSLLFGVGAGDPLTYAAMAGLLALVVLAACYVSARRAVRLDPTLAIRQE